MSESVLSVQRLRVRYGAVEVLHGVDLDLQAGQVLSVLGSNGAGKSTLLKVIAGLHPATTGDVRFSGRLITRWGPDRRARAGLCLIPEGRGIFPRLTVRENLWMATHLGVSRADVEERAFAQFPRLAERRDQVAGSMSGGEQQMLALARAVATYPKVLMVDELSMGLAPQLVESLFGSIRELAAGGMAVLVVEQFAKAALAVADRAALMASGRIVEQGTPQQVEQHLSTAYLGA